MTEPPLPAPQLDAEIARRVMKTEPLWKVSAFPDGGGQIGALCDSYEGAMMRAGGNDPFFRNTQGYVHPVYPPYSTDIAATWTVVEVMRERGYAFEVGCNPDRKKTGYESTFWEPYEEGKMVRMWEAEAPTAPEAICRAALKALEAANG